MMLRENGKSYSMNGCEAHFVGNDICLIVQTCFKSNILGNHSPWVKFLTNNLLNEHLICIPHVYAYALRLVLLLAFIRAEDEWLMLLIWYGRVWNKNGIG